jgi:hypothetical protein
VAGCHPAIEMRTDRKDLADIMCQLADHPIGRDGDGEIGLKRMVDALSADWGFTHTVERNLGKVAELWDEDPVLDASCPIPEQIAAIRAALDAAPKSLGWKARARIGELVRWYETPEEVQH